MKGRVLLQSLRWWVRIASTERWTTIIINISKMKIITSFVYCVDGFYPKNGRFSINWLVCTNHWKAFYLNFRLMLFHLTLIECIALNTKIQWLHIHTYTHAYWCSSKTFITFTLFQACILCVTLDNSTMISIIPWQYRHNEQTYTTVVYGVKHTIFALECIIWNATDGSCQAYRQMWSSFSVVSINFQF